MIYKDRNIAVVITKHFNKGLKRVTPFVSVIYIDANRHKHLIETFVDKPCNVGIVAGDLMQRLLEQIGDR